MSCDVDNNENSCILQGEHNVLTCRVPRCLKARRRQGQADGRFLMEYWQDKASVYVMVVCPECGTQYVVEIVKK